MSSRTPSAWQIRQAVDDHPWGGSVAARGRFSVRPRSPRLTKVGPFRPE
ncbi:hypothetical protein [Bogoriella caseilytica]|uniref:Uncharacterized protein n=1 Tax=Bogoriella caseilytica TaxID=56055 RepID=A0A3N2BA07_9MICO|nr:hypothetical protein [Bogoriella caseilytica]ROR72113.1 hypothetical protein EDD31_0460 [Bogoriella caseilytica]